MCPVQVVSQLEIQLKSERWERAEYERKKEAVGTAAC